jgi:protease-4
VPRPRRILSTNLWEATCVLPLTILLWLVVALLAALAVGTAARAAAGAWRRRRGALALVLVEAPIGVGGGWLSSSVDARELVGELAAIRRDRSVKGVLLRIDSPGGAVGATEEIAREIERVEASGRPVVASVGNAALSGGFWLAMAADAVVAPPGALLGSIGVIIAKPELSRLLERLGVRRLAVKSRPHKDFMSPDRPWDEEEEAFLEDVNREIFDRFVDHVARRRGLAREAVLAVADGRVFTAAWAKAHGFVDALGNVEDALAELRRRAGVDEAAPVRVFRRRRWWRPA